MMDLRKLRYAVAVAEQLNFTEAARSQNVSQSALSQQIGQLEAELGVCLFARSPQRVTLTRAGELVIDHARRTLDSAARLQDEVEAFRGVRRGKLRIAVTQSFNAFHLAPALSAFIGEYPQVDVTAFEWSNDAIISGVLEGEVDLGVVFGPIDAAVSSRHLYHDNLMLACASDHRLAAMASIPVQRLAEETLALLPPPFGTRRAIDAFLTRHGVEPKRIVEVDTFQAILKLVELGNCVSIVPGHQTVDEAREPLSFRPLQPAPDRRSIVLISPIARLRSPASEVFGRIIVAAFANRAS